MRWLTRLITPPGGVVLDPFAGSGTTLVAATLEGFDTVGIEAKAVYLPIIEGRVRWAEGQQQSLWAADQ
jgi:site-specific DNA-methyltransferase (adenine-specific)